MTTNAPTTDAGLVQAAGRGDTEALASLWARHAEPAWGFAIAVTGAASETDQAAGALVTGMDRAIDGLRTGRLEPTTPFLDHVLTATRDAALDAADVTEGAGEVRAVSIDVHRPDPHGRSPVLLAAFASLPERWRSALWLHGVTGLDAERLARILHLEVGATETLIDRARLGLVEQHVRTGLLAVPADRTCERAVGRFGGAATGTLPAPEVDRLELHLGLCAACRDRFASVNAAEGELHTLAPPVPASAASTATATVTTTAAVAATPRRTATGLSDRTEKVLAGVSAVAAAVGVVGAALYGFADDEQAIGLAAAPLSPLVDRVVTPMPTDMGDLDLGILRRALAGPPGMTPDTIAPAPDRSQVLGAGAPNATPEPAPIAAQGPAAEGTPAGPAPAAPSTPSPPAPSTPLPLPAPDIGPDGVAVEVAGVPVVVDVGDTPGVTIGPVSLGEPDSASTTEAEVGTVDDPIGEAAASGPATAAPVASAVEAGPDQLVG